MDWSDSDGENESNLTEQLKEIQLRPSTSEDIGPDSNGNVAGTKSVVGIMQTIVRYRFKVATVAIANLSKK